MATTFKFGGGNWAVKDGYALAYNDENNNFKPLPFDFTRASTATRVNKQGLIETVPSGKPRIDFLDNTSGHLLLEPSRTNLINYSEAISNAPVKSGTFTDNFAISPDGTQNATKLTATNTDPYFYQSVAFTAGDYTASIWVKGIGGAIGKQFRFAISGETHSSNKYDIPSEWTRFEFTATISTGTFTTGLEIPDPAVSGDEVLVWGWQVEAGSYATSYIPTEGSSVTRVAERNSQGNLSNLLSSSGVLYIEIELGESTTDTSSSNLRFSLSNNGSTSDWVFFGIEGGDNLRTYVRASGSTSTDAITNAVFPSAGTYKIAFRFDLNNTKVFVNGVQKYSDTSSTPPSNLNFFQQGGVGAGASDIAETLKVIETRLYNTALTDTELQNLTS